MTTASERSRNSRTPISDIDLENTLSRKYDDDSESSSSDDDENMSIDLDEIKQELGLGKESTVMI